MSVNFPYSRINTQVKNPAGLVQRNLEYLAEQIGSLGQSSAFVNVKDAQFGAKGDGTTNDTAAIADAIASLPTTGGIVMFPPGTYVANIHITDNKRVYLLGYGATIKPASGTAIHIDGVAGSAAAGHAIEGFEIESPSSGTGILVTNTDRVTISCCRIEGGAVGIELKSDAGEWVEGVSIYDTIIFDCTTVGIFFNKTASGTGSFGETLMAQVGINNCATGLRINSGAHVYRSTFDTITIWMSNNQKGVLLEGSAEGSVFVIGLECQDTGTGVVGFDVTSTATNTHLLQLYLDFQGNFATRIQAASGKPIVYQEGIDRYELQNSAGFRLFKHGNSWESVSLVAEAGGGGGIVFGGGTASPDVWITREAADLLAVGSGGLMIDTQTAAGTGFLQFFEQSASPATPVSASARIFLRDDPMDGAQLCIRYPSGAVKVIVAENV